MAKAKLPKALINGVYKKIPVEQLNEAAHNYNVMTPFMFGKLVAGITERGFTEPIVVRTLPDGTYEIIGGNHRVRAAKKLGMPEVPAIDVSPCSDMEARQLMITLNETHGSADTDQLSKLIREIHEVGGDEALDLLPYTDAQKADYLDVPVAEEEDDGMAPPIEDSRPAKLKPGDVGSVLELEGASQKDIKRVITALRAWRATKSEDAPAWRHLIDALNITEQADQSGEEE